MNRRNAGAWALTGIAIGLTSLLLGSSAFGAETATPPATNQAPRISPWPEIVAGVKEARLDLDGTWHFGTVPATDFTQTVSEPIGSNASEIQVPGQWLQQGFSVSSNSAGIYHRSFTVPADWTGQRIKLRCEAIYSDATVWIDGKKVGHHLGGFTPFEIDVTDVVHPGSQSTITLAVKSESEADTMASGMKYACHDLGGISRKIQLIAMPPVNLASLHITTTFDSEYKNATLQITARVANDGNVISEPGKLELALIDPQNHFVLITPTEIDIPALQPGETVTKTITIPVAAPQKWDPEHPRLYSLSSTIHAGKAMETIATRIGFRQVEVRGNQLFVNGCVVKLRGVCRHEIDPLRGRSLIGDIWRKDVDMLIRANINFIRTSHYPPAEEFLDACDELGVFVESEAPICWAKDGRESLPLVLNETAEMVEFNRNHPSVIIWSIANESSWGSHFDLSAKMVGELDPSRPRIFSYGEVDLVSWHYPTNARIADTDRSPKPVLSDEYCHLNAYNRREQIADPGLRDFWGEDFSRMWETMRSHAGSLGGAIWAGIDDTFFLSEDRTVGYGTWGIIDEWRRPKPEYWHVTKVYSPARILDDQVAVPSAGQPIRLTIENRSDFADLNEMRFDWKLAEESGTATTEGAPGQKEILEIPVKGTDLSGKILDIRITGPRGFIVDAYHFTIGGENNSMPPPLRSMDTLQITQNASAIRVSGNGFAYLVDATTGQLTQATVSGHKLLLSGPYLTLTPHDKEGGGVQMTNKEPAFPPLWGLCTAWKASSVTVTPTEKKVTIKVEGAYAEATGEYELSIDGSGRIAVTWNFKMKNEINPRQIGMTFTLPKSCDVLSWKRRAEWSCYPEDHIGRPTGTAKASYGHPASGLTGPRTPPKWPWNEDENQYGSNDFRSTKLNILEAALTNNAGIGLRAIAAADRHAHAWIDGDHAMLMIADYANEGSDTFTQFTRIIPDQKIAKGGSVTGSVNIEVLDQKHSLPLAQ